MIKTDQQSGLHYIARDNGATLNIVMIHGFGANAMDLSFLAEEADMLRANWFFPEGPFPTDAWGRAWFPIDFAFLEEAWSTGNLHAFAAVDPAGLTEAGELISIFMQSLSLDPSTTVIGGFSQGAMLAMEVASRLSVPPLGLLLFSPTLTSRSRREADNFSTKIFLSHGREDMVLPFDLIAPLAELLCSRGAVLEEHYFSGGHTIPPQILSAAAKFLRGLAGV